MYFSHTWTKRHKFTFLLDGTYELKPNRSDQRQSKERQETFHFSLRMQLIGAEEPLFIWPENTAEIPDSFMVNRGKFFHSLLQGSSPHTSSSLSCPLQHSYLRA